MVANKKNAARDISQYYYFLQCRRNFYIVFTTIDSTSEYRIIPREGMKISTLKQLLQRLPKWLGQVKTGNTFNYLVKNLIELLIFCMNEGKLGNSVWVYYKINIQLNTFFLLTGKIARALIRIDYYLI